MKVIFDDRQLSHDPQHYFRRGALVDHPEQPQRAILIRDALRRAGHELLAPDDHGRGPIEGVHDAGYVQFLLTAWDDWIEATGGQNAAVANYHPHLRYNRLPKGVIGKLGYYIADTSCPIVEGTAEAIYWSAQSAIHAASLVAAGENHAYALCRPPGHHAHGAQASGFCFLNNAAIAANQLRGRYDRVGIIDIDTHAGNGTQEIFYARGDVHHISIHVDPSDYPPYYLGYADETGVGEGADTTRNFIIQPGDGVEQISDAIRSAVALTRAFGAEALVVSLGFDMAADDPLSLVRMTTEGFTAAADALESLNVPTVLIQEGGYLGPSLADNAEAFLGRFQSRRAERIGGA